MIESDSDTSDETPQEYVSVLERTAGELDPMTRPDQAQPEQEGHLPVKDKPTATEAPEAPEASEEATTGEEEAQLASAASTDPETAASASVARLNISPSPPASIPESPQPEQIATLSASAVLPSLPTDTAEVLERFSEQLKNSKVKCQLKFRPIGGATPGLKQSVYKIAETQQFSVVVKFLRKHLKVKNSQLFCYINSFAPGLDETVGSLHNRFAIRGELTISYCINQAFG